MEEAHEGTHGRRARSQRGVGADEGDADRSGVEVRRVRTDHAAVDAAAWIVPGMADGTLGLAIGYGRGAEAGTLATGSGFAAHPLRTSKGMYLAVGAKASKGTGTYDFAHTQDHGSVDAALYAFVAFYVSCIVLTWWFYARKGAEMPC